LSKKIPADIPSGDVTPQIIELQEKAREYIKAPISQLQISIPVDNEDKDEDIHVFEELNGEENLHESSEKKRVVGNPKTGGIKTGTHLGHENQSKNIFLNKFVCNSTKNSREN
jgi:hypothetical protein